MDGHFAPHSRIGTAQVLGYAPRNRSVELIAALWPDSDRINFCGQTTFVEQAYPSFRSPYVGTNSLPGTGQGRETWDATLYTGVQLWQGAELWFNPEIDQGMGLGQTHGVAGFPSTESYKLGFDYPYARMQRAFVRQTIDLGGAPEKVMLTSINSPDRGPSCADNRDCSLSSHILTPTNMRTMRKPIS
jgi:hypothetical protein